MTFAHLHVHSCYSLLDGTIRIKELVETAKAMNMPAAALTDHGQMFGLLEFYRTARQAGLNPVLGVEAYVAAAGRRSRVRPDLRHHLILLAENLAGYRNLCRLISRANIEGFYYKPRLDKELLAEHGEGLIALSACLQGEVPWLLLNRSQAEAARAAEEYARLFPGRFYLELQHNGLPEQEEANAGLKELGRTLGLPLVAANDCHYLSKEDAEMHDVMLCVQTQTTVDDKNRLSFPTKEFYFKSPAEMAEAFRNEPEALANTLEIASRCQVEFPKAVYAFPAVPEEKLAGLTEAERLASQAGAGLEERFETGGPWPEDKKKIYRDRLESELAVIIKMGFPGYFLIVADFINWAKRRGIPVGPGRGSAAGSLAAYALRITEVDPIRFDLLFERFLNPGRRSMPDIDVDFCADRREEVMRYVTETYGGQERVTQIITFGRLKARAAIKAVGRALGLPYAEMDRLAKLVPNELNISLEKALEKEPRLRQEAEARPELFRFARRAEDLPANAGTHAAGVVIGDKPLMEHLPLGRVKEESLDEEGEKANRGEKTQIVTQFDLHGVEALGLVKFDFLGLKNLTVIDHCLASLRERGVEVDFRRMDFDDGPTYVMLARGDSSGVFQLESSGIRGYLLRLKPNCLEDLMALVALYRPGPLASGMADEFVTRKHKRGRARAAYGLSQLDPILRETYGVVLYQEQVMRLSQVLANFSLSQADDLRKAMGKKDAAKMAAQKADFLAGARTNGIAAGKAEQIFEDLAKFAEYGFNKSHSAAYAVVTYQTAYLKANFPAEFMAALLSSEKNQKKVGQLIGEARAAGLEVLPPDVNESGGRFTVVKGSLRFGLGAVKGLGEGAIEAILAARLEGGPFAGLFDFCERVDAQKINSRALEALIKCGAFDLSGGADRSVLYSALGEAQEAGIRRQRDRREGQNSLFEVLDATGPAERKWPRAELWSKSERLKYEKEALGFFITGHPLDNFEKELASLGVIAIEEAKAKPDRTEVRLGGVVADLKRKKTKKGQNYVQLVLEDRSGGLGLTVWPDVLETCQDWLDKDQIALAIGLTEAEVKEGGSPSSQVIVREIMPLAVAAERKIARLAFNIPRSELNQEMIDFLKETVQAYPGSAETCIRLAEPDGLAVYRLRARLRPCRELADSVRGRLGEEGLEFG